MRIPQGVNFGLVPVYLTVLVCAWKHLVCDRNSVEYRRALSWIKHSCLILDLARPRLRGNLTGFETRRTPTREDATCAGVNIYCYMLTSAQVLLSSCVYCKELGLYQSECGDVSSLHLEWQIWLKQLSGVRELNSIYSIYRLFISWPLSDLGTNVSWLTLLVFQHNELVYHRERILSRGAVEKVLDFEIFWLILAKNLETKKALATKAFCIKRCIAII